MPSLPIFRRLKSQLETFPSQFWMLVIVTFIDGLGGYLLFPFFTLYITSHFQVGMSSAGLVFAVYSISGVAGAWIGGGLVDHFGRRKVIIFSLVASSLGSVFIGLLDSFNAFLLAAAPLGVLNSIGRPAYNAMTADLLPAEKRTRGFGVLLVAFNLAAAIGPAIGGFIAARSYMALFISDAAISMVAVLVFILTIAETKPRTALDAPKADLAATFRGYQRVLADHRFLFFVGVGVLCGFTYVNMSTTLAVFLRDVHGLPEQGYGMLRSLHALMIISLQIWVTRRVEARPPFRMMALGALLYGVGFALFGFTSTFALFALSIVIICFADMIAIPLEQMLITRYAPEDMRGRYIALHGIALSLPLALGPYLGGLVLDSGLPNLLWYAVGAIGLAAALGYLSLGRILKNRIPAPSAD